MLDLFIEIGKGAYQTLLYTTISFFFSFILANMIAIYNSQYNNLLSNFFKLYISIFRGTPVIVQLFIIYFSLPQILNIQLNPFVSVVIGLALNSAAYLSEILRAGIQTIDKGQFEAAQVLGISKFFMWRDIIGKQMLIISFPNIINEFINLLKETAVISMVGGNDILNRAKNIGAQTFSPTEPLLIAAFYYYILIFILTQISRYFEKRIRL